MLDNETRRRIDSARDILVGKVPDPKSQVEQITIALIYKFMDDMDKEAIEFGGKASFFTGEYEKYGWSKIFDPRLGGYEMLSLYGEAIEKLDQNPNIPQLFRDIFKNAYLPYRDPETLKLFLKTINEFHYDHSEKLGDAFEYLLSVLGSQGDAGQFRTPRHIIDFIVNILQPKKNETILDPACGTAGFLISSYKYMLKENTNKTQGDLLTPADRKKLMNNFTGYDISPDMMRLSLVNMYLHHFTSPKIYEYDTLTSEDRWGDYFDIIMANPPFMTPKGGIKPHKKFTMQANRSEVLFVDYIAEHINPTTGRAGVIVPEGIIFQSATAYKALRKLLVDKNYLYAVISLPAGIFNPYSGVKTSVLLMDKTIAKKTDKILFVKIENDGFDLGAQRKVIAKNDLTNALEVINNYQLKIKNDETVETLDGNYLLIDKEKVKANDDYNLSIDRYRINKNVKDGNYNMIALGEVCELQTGSRQKGGAISDGIPSIGGEQIAEDGSIKFDKMKFVSLEHFHSMKKGILKKGDVLLVKDGATTGKVGYYFGEYKAAAINEHVYILRTNEKIKSYFLYQLIKTNNFQEILKKYVKGIIGGISSEISTIQIPLPPLSIQQEIVNKIEGWQKIIDGAKQIIENYKPQIDINPDWEMVELREVCSLITDGKHGDCENETNSGYYFLSAKDVRNDTFTWEDARQITKSCFEETHKRTNLMPGDICMVNTGATIGRISIAPNDPKTFKTTFQKSVAVIKTIPSLINNYYCCYILKSDLEQLVKVSSGSAVHNLLLGDLKKHKISIPKSLSEQQQIVNRIEQEQQLINANKQLIQIFEQKIKDEINKLWQTDAKEYAIEDAPLSLVAEE